MMKRNDRNYRSKLHDGTKFGGGGGDDGGGTAPRVLNISEYDEFEKTLPA